MKHNFKFIYPKSMRSLIDEKRHYEVESTKLPSVTTILSATMPDDKKKALDAWKEKVGNIEADEYYMMSEGNLVMPYNGSEIYRKSYIRRLTTGSLIGEI